MKRKLSISIEESTFQEVVELLKDNNYRNKSHVIELAIQRFAGDKK